MGKYKPLVKRYRERGMGTEWLDGKIQTTSEEIQGKRNGNRVARWGDSVS